MGKKGKSTPTFHKLKLLLQIYFRRSTVHKLRVESTGTEESPLWQGSLNLSDDEGRVYFCRSSTFGGEPPNVDYQLLEQRWGQNFDEQLLGVGGTFAEEIGEHQRPRDLSVQSTVVRCSQPAQYPRVNSSRCSWCYYKTCQDQSSGVPTTRIKLNGQAVAARRGYTIKGFEDVYLKAKTRLWSWLGT